MRYMLIKEFEDLYSEYQNAESREERMIKLKLNEIAACYAECGIEEREFADAITKKFCEVISLVKEQGIESHSIESDGIRGFMNNKLREEPLPYESGDNLLMAFYNHFAKEKTAATLKDYAARIQTFAFDKHNEYLYSIFTPDEVGNEDPILFTYRNIEYIIAKFDTKKNGETSKQRLNIRSALRKLNDFKREKEDLL